MSEQEENAKVLVIAGVVICQDDKFLLVQEKQQKAYKQWNLPGGRVDVGETIEQAAIREAKEEAGYDVELGQELIVLHLDIKTPVLHVFAATIVGGSLAFPEDEILDAKWFSYEELTKLDLRNTRYVLGAIDAFRA